MKRSNSLMNEEETQPINNSTFNNTKEDSKFPLFTNSINKNNIFTQLNKNEDNRKEKKNNNKSMNPIKSFREDDSHNNLHSEYSKSGLRSENDFEHSRKLVKKEKICDTDTEDEGSDSEKAVKWVIMPDDSFKKVWDMIVALIILYSSIVTPYKIAFLDEPQLEEVDIASDVLLALDIVFNFFSAYTDNEDNIVKNRKKIIITYLKTWFTIDLVSILPISYFTDNSYKFNNLTRIGRLPKLYRLLKLTKLLRMTKIAKKGNVNRLTKFFLQKLKVNANIERLIYFILSFLLLNHISACIWFFVAKLQDLDPDCWVTRLGFIDSTNFEIYVISFYWTLTTVTTVGYGDISAGTTIERAYNLLVMSFGVLMYSFAIGYLSSIVSQLDAKTAEMNQKLQILSSIKKEFNLDQEIYDKVKRVIKYDLSRNQKDKMNFLQELPNKLRIELSQIMHDKVIQNMYFFKDQPTDFIAYVAPLLKPVKFSQYDFLYKVGDVIDEMYFVSKGTVILCLGKEYNEKEIKEIKKNNNFGEIEMCLNEKLSCNIKIKSRSCELFVLKKNDFLRLSVNFKEFIEKFLHKSLMIYLKFIEDKKKMMREEESKMTKQELDRINTKKSNTNLEIVNEEDKEEEEYSEYDINSEYESENSVLTEKEENEEIKEEDDQAIPINNSINLVNNNKSNSFKDRRSSIRSTGNELMLPKIHDNTGPLMKMTSSSFKLNKDEKLPKYSSDQDADSVPQKNPIYDDNDDPVIKMKNEINKKFIKKIDKILEYLDNNNINYENFEENPKTLLRQLKAEGNILEKNYIIDSIENILKDIYKASSNSIINN